MKIRKQNRILAEAAKKLEEANALVEEANSKISEVFKAVQERLAKADTDEMNARMYQVSSIGDGVVEAMDCLSDSIVAINEMTKDVDDGSESED